MAIASDTAKIPQHCIGRYFQKLGPPLLEVLIMRILATRDGCVGFASLFTEFDSSLLLRYQALVAGTSKDDCRETHIEELSL